MTENQRRKFLKLVGASLVGVAGVGVLAAVTRHDFTEIRNPTRKELAGRLRKLAWSIPPWDLASPAPCYSMAFHHREKKPCPKCERTMEVGEMDELLSTFNVPLKRIQDQELDAKLILPEHCPECGFGLEDCGLHWEQIKELSPTEQKAKKFHLELTYPDHPDPIRVELDSAHDLELMALFLQGKDRYPAFQGSEEALKWKVGRLRELFGVATEPQS